MKEKQGQLTADQELDNVLSQIRDYALRENLSAAQVRQLFNVGIVAKGVLDSQPAADGLYHAAFASEKSTSIPNSCCD